MLDQLLELLRAGGTHRVTDLARELETTSALVEMMLENLCRMGYLKQVGEECGRINCIREACGACPMVGLCAAGEGGRVWVLADKLHPMEKAQ